MGDVLCAVRFDGIATAYRVPDGKSCSRVKPVIRSLWQNGWHSPARTWLMLPRHKKALSDIKSAEKQLRDARTKYRKTKEELAKARKRVVEAQTRLRAAQDLYES